ncbi:MAG: hypothetical protein QXZ36_02495, partial [Thermoproteota archaeon]
MEIDETSRAILEKLGEDEKKLVEKELKPGELILSIATGDLSEDGNYSKYLFIVTNTRVLKISGEGVKHFELEIEKATQAIFNDYLGNSELILVVGGKEIPVARFSRDKISEFRHATGVINALLQYKDPKEIEFKLYLENNGKSRKSAIIWLISYLKPHWYLVLSGLTLSVVITGLNLVPPSLLRTLIDQIATQ